VKLRIHEGLPPGFDDVDALLSQVGAVLVVWDAALAGTASNAASLRDYVARHLQQLRGEARRRTYRWRCRSAVCNMLVLLRSFFIRLLAYWCRGLRRDAQRRDPSLGGLRTLVLCNKTDSTPCPLPMIEGLGAGDLFLAGSAQRGTNMSALWRRVEACAAPFNAPAGAWKAPASAAAPMLATNTRVGKSLSWRDWLWGTSWTMNPDEAADGSQQSSDLRPSVLTGPLPIARARSGEIAGTSAPELPPDVNRVSKAATAVAAATAVDAAATHVSLSSDEEEWDARGAVKDIPTVATAATVVAAVGMPRRQ